MKGDSAQRRSSRDDQDGYSIWFYWLSISWLRFFSKPYGDGIVFGSCSAFPSSREARNIILGLSMKDEKGNLLPCH